MFYRSASNEKSNADKYLENCAKDFVFDLERGIYTPKAYYKKRKGKHFQGFFKIATLILNAFTLYYLIRYTHYARKQWVEAKRTADQSVISANAAQSAATTANATLKSSQKSFEVDQRPYLVSQIPEFTELPAPNKEIYANETIKNIGRTPALTRITSISFNRFDIGNREKLIRFLTSEFRKLRRNNEAQAKELESYASGTIPDVEMDTAPQDMFFGTNQNSIKLSEDELKNLRDGKGITLFYTGLVNYRDSFGNDYETQFCYFYFGPYPKIWHICDSHNIIR